MSDEAPAVGSAAGSASEGTPAVGGEGTASAGSGAAPGSGVDAGGSEGAPAVAAVSAPAEYLFRGRKFRDQKHAEEVFGSEVDRVRGVQRQNAELQRSLEARDAELASLRALVSRQSAAGQVQGATQGPKDGQRSLADRLNADGTLDLISEMASNPELGMKHAIYALAQALEGEIRTGFDGFKSDVLEPMFVRQAQERGVARGIAATRDLYPEYPWLDEQNDQSDAAIDARDEVFRILSESFSPEQVAKDTGRCLRMAIREYIDANGTPVTGQPPGTSGSTSVRAAQAAEAAQAASAAVPLDGTGVPRPRQSGTESPQDRMRRENRLIDERALKTPTGRRLWAAS